jgi:diketogulonate reductase-like aldo/keto reductase
VELGLSHVDTAEMYGAGRVEEIVGEALEGIRDRVFLVSKVLPSNATFDGAIQACERSLKRLRTDRLDGYLLHWRESLPLEPCLRAFGRLARDGKIGSWGVSNFDVEDLEEALAIAGPGKIACNQVLYHLKERAIEHRVIPWCEAQGVAVVAYSPYGQGDFPAGSAALERIAKARGATARQAALAFLTRRSSVLTIPKSSDLRHVEENAGALGLELEEREIAEIDRAFPRGRPGPLPML